MVYGRCSFCSLQNWRQQQQWLTKCVFSAAQNTSFKTYRSRPGVYGRFRFFFRLFGRHRHFRHVFAVPVVAPPSILLGKTSFVCGCEVFQKEFRWALRSCVLTRKIHFFSAAGGGQNSSKLPLFANFCRVNPLTSRISETPTFRGI